MYTYIHMHTYIHIYNILHDFILYVGVLSPEGYCRPFDSNGNGYSRSEAVAIVYLQKAKNAKRIYAICPHIKLNSDGYKEEGITYPSLLMQSILLKECYNECRILTSCLDYIETHGTGTKVGDLQEVTAICNSLCKNRETPLMIGSVKSNLGHGEPASGFIQIAKVKVTAIFIYYYRICFYFTHSDFSTIYTYTYMNKQKTYFFVKIIRFYKSQYWLRFT